MAFIKSQNRGFTIIDLMISVSVVGFMAVIAIPSFQEYVMTSKIAESYQIITALQNAEKSYFIENNEFRWMGTQPFLLDDDMNEVTYSLANNELGNPLAEGSSPSWPTKRISPHAASLLSGPGLRPDLRGRGGG